MTLHGEAHPGAFFFASIVAAIAIALPTSPRAGEFLTEAESKIGVLSHGAGVFSSGDGGGVEFNFEHQFGSPEFLALIGSPRPHLGAKISTSDDEIHQVYGGLSWNYQFAGDFIASGHLGASVHTSDELNEPESGGDPDARYLGCRVLFRLAAGLGYRISESVTVELFADHVSNANLCRSNEGLESAGIRLGYLY